MDQFFFCGKVFLGALLAPVKKFERRGGENPMVSRLADLSLRPWMDGGCIQRFCPHQDPTFKLFGKPWERLF